MTGSELKNRLREAGIKQESAAQSLGVTLRTLQNWLKLEVLDANMMAKIKENLNIDLDHSSANPSGRDMNGYRMVPVYNFDVVGGMDAWADVVDSPAYIERYIPFLGAAEKDICVRVTGNSMMPTYSAGSLLLIRGIEGWREYFGYGHCYVLLLKDGRRILKEVQKSEIDPQKFVLCVSYNPQNPPEELPRDFIVGVYKVIMTLTNEGF